jgi:hypothetical protein
VRISWSASEQLAHPVWEDMLLAETASPAENTQSGQLGHN